jgi:hypothetical protein
MNKIAIPIIILILVIISGIGAYFILQKSSLLQSLTPSEQLPQQSVTSSLFGTMIAYSINDAAANTPSIFDAINQKGWTRFREDDSTYQSLLINLKKLIQDRTKLVKATGFSLDREIVPYFTWNLIEPQKGQFNWELTDIYVQAASDAGVKISAVIQPFASWDQKNTQLGKEALDFAYYDYKAGPPKDINEYQNFLTKMVERYKDEVSVWEIGNEPENPGGGYKNNPEGYFNLVKITSETIKKADPEAKVTNGGAMEIVGKRESDSFKSYWTKFFALGGGQYLDYFNIHYNIGRSPDAKLDTIIFEKNLIAFNNLMDKNGGRKPLYLTEFGIYSGSPSSQPFDQPAQGQIFGDGGGKCGDNICDDFEKQNPNVCPQDCGGSTLGENQEQPFGQPIQEQVIGQNIQPNKEQILRNLTESDQAVLYFKYSILAFANGANFIFIDLRGLDDNIIGSSMAFNADDQPRLFLTTLKMIDNKISGFSKVERITSGQYKFTIGSKNIYALWLGVLPNEILGQVRVTDIKGQEQFTDAAGIKLSTDQPVFIELHSDIED